MEEEKGVAGIAVGRMKRPTAAEKEGEGGMAAGPSKFFQFRGEMADQKISSQGQPRSMISPIAIVLGRFHKMGNWASIVYTTQYNLLFVSSEIHRFH